MKSRSNIKKSTSQKEATELLTEEKKYLSKFHNLLLQTPVAIAIYRGNDYIAELANDLALGILNKDKNLIGKPLFESIPELESQLKPIFDKVMQTGIPFHSNEFGAILFRNGENVKTYFNTIFKPLREDDDTISGIIVVANEVTDQVIARKKMEDSEKRYNMMLMNSPFGFAILKGKNMLITLANDSIKTFWGKGNDVEGKPLFDVISELKESAFPSLIENVYNTGIPFTGEELLAPIIRNGKQEDVYFNFVYQPYLEADETISGVTIIAFEVTAQVMVKKALEAQREAEQKALKMMEETNKRYYSMLMDSPFAFCVMKGKDMTVALANDLTIELWGKGNMVEGKTLLEVLPEMKNQPFPAMLDKVFTTGIPVYFNETLARLQHKDIMEERYFNIVYQPDHGADGTISGVIQIAYDVTETVLARKKIEDSDKRYNMMLMKSPFAFAILKGKDMVLAMANDSIKEMWGKGNEIEGKPLIEVLPELKGQGFTELLDKVYTTGIPYIANEALAKVKRNGKMEDVYFNFVYQPYRETDNTISGVTIIAIEVTNEVIAKQKIKDSQQQLQNIFMQAPFALNIYEGKELVISLANKLFCEIIGKTESEILGKKLFDAFPETATQGLGKILSDVFSTGIPFKGNEFPVHFLKNGNEFKGYFDFIYQPIFDYNKNVSGVINVAIDVTDKVLARKKIEESEHRYHELIYSSPSMIAIFKGEDMIIEIANDSIMESWGKGKDIIGKSLLSIMPEVIEQGFDKILSDVYKTGIPFHAYEEPVSLFRNEKLEVLHYTYIYQAQRNINGEIEGVAVIANEVTPQAILNLQIRESEGRFRQLVQQAPVAICVIRGEKYVVEIVNAGMLEFWGTTEDQVLHKPIFEALTELEGQGFEALVHGVYTTGQKFVGTELPVTLLRKGQLENAYVTFVYEPLRELDGTISGIMVLAHEITDLVVERKKIEAQVMMHEDMLMHAPYVICTLDGPDHVYSFVNEQYQQLFGNRILKGKPFLKAIPEFEGQGFDKILDNIYHTGETYIGNDIPATFPQQEGQTPELRYFNFSYQPMFDENQKIYSILGFGYEVTEIVNTRKKIEISEKKFRLLTNNMPQKISNANAEGNVIFFNQQWLDATGLTFEELRDWGWEKAIHPDDLEFTVNNWKHSVATGDIFELEHRIQYKEGGYRWNLSRAVPIKDENGKIETWVGSNTDIHEQKVQKEVLQDAVAERTLELSEANNELKRMNKELEAFAYVSSHDLQEPLRKIRTMAGRIMEKENENLSDSGKHYFHLMQNAAERMQTLIQDLLTFSRLSMADRKFENTDLNIIIEDIKKEFKETIEEKNAVIEVKEICNAKIIPFQFRQLMDNLIGNALKFSNPNRPPHIKISSVKIPSSQINEANLSADTAYCHISIADNGIGFEKEFAEKIFEVFQKLHAKDEYAGTGIGLAIVKKIVENHHGIITAISELDKGTTFNIYIPA